MAFLARMRATRVAAITTGGPTQDITVSGLTDTPVAALLYMTSATSTVGAAADHNIMSVGITDGTFEGGIGNASKHNSASTWTRHVQYDDSIFRYQKVTGLGGTEARATFDSFISGGIRINWNTLPLSAYLVHAIFWVGEALEVEAGTVTPPKTGHTAVNVGFEPDILITLSADEPNNEQIKLDYQAMFGLAVNTGSGAIQRDMISRQETGKASGDPQLRVDDDLADLSAPTPPPPIGGVRTALDATTPFESTGFRVVTIGSTTDAGPPINYLAISVGEKSVDLQIETTPTVTGDASFTGYGFKPDSCIGLATITDNAWPSITYINNSEAGNHGLGFFDDGNDEWCVSCQDEDAAATTNTSCRTVNRALSMSNDTATALDWEARFTSMDSDGFTIDFLFAPGTGKKFAILAIEEDVFTGTGAGTFPAMTGTGTGALVFDGPGAGDFPAMTGTGMGALIFAGVGAGTFAAMTGTGTGAAVFQGTGAGVFPATTGTGTGELQFVAQGTAVLPHMTGTGAGEMVMSGTGAGSFPPMAAAGVAALIFAGTGVGTFAALAGAGTGAQVFAATGAGSFPPMQAASVGRIVFAGTGAGVFPPMAAAGVAALVFAGTGAGVFPFMTGTGTGTLITDSQAVCIVELTASFDSMVDLTAGFNSQSDQTASWDQEGILTGSTDQEAILAAGFMNTECCLTAGYKETVEIAAEFDQEAVLAAGYAESGEIAAEFDQVGEFSAGYRSTVSLTAGYNGQASLRGSIC